MIWIFFFFFCCCAFSFSFRVDYQPFSFRLFFPFLTLVLPSSLLIFSHPIFSIYNSLQCYNNPFANLGSLSRFLFLLFFFYHFWNASLLFCLSMSSSTSYPYPYPSSLAISCQSVLFFFLLTYGCNFLYPY